MNLHQVLILAAEIWAVACVGTILLVMLLAGASGVAEWMRRRQ